MDFVLWLALSGGLFAIMTFIHFFVDWIFQSHAEAMAKHNNAGVRFRHCAIYMIGFVPLLAFFLWCHVLAPWQYFLSLAILFFSHFVEDTYLPVYWWAKYIRKPPEMEEDPKAGFVAFVQTPLGKILMIAIDQIIHIAFLFPVVWMVVWNMMKAFYQGGLR
jgi:hypothetical protein